uniref:Thymosin beta 1 n=1 Tax=Paramormyrops kingsleyae TaxID=1676925 RepID=A0A3B3SXP3_9TELE
MSDNPVSKEVQTFDKRCLKKTNTAEKNKLPTKEESILPSAPALFPVPLVATQPHSTIHPPL